MYECGIIYVIFLSVLINNSVYCAQSSSISSNILTKRNFIYNNTYKYDSIIYLTVNDTTEQVLDFYEESDRWRGFPTRVHVSSNDTINSEYPIFITATQQKSVSSWELPLVVRTSHSVMQFNDMARTLCPHDAGPNMTSVNRPLIQLTTSNPNNVSVSIKLRRISDFYVELGKKVELNATPSSPKYYYFSFDNDPLNVTDHKEGRFGYLPRFNYTIPKSVILIIESDDDVCAIVSIQNNSCPVMDNEADVTYQGYHLTMTTKGGITLTQSMFPVGFYIVFIVKQNDEECTGVSETADSWSERDSNIWGEEYSWREQVKGPDGRVKVFRFRVIATVSYSQYSEGALVTLALVLALALFCVAAHLPLCNTDEVVVEVVEEGPAPPEPAAGPSGAQVRLDNNRNRHISDESLSDSECDQLTGVTPLTVAGLSRARPNAHYRKSSRYFWSALTVAVVYALPVVQLLSTYQHMVFQTGNQDLCYYNFLCAHPLAALSDFNHVYSNIGYIVLGIVFMIQTRVRQLADRNRPQGMGIPPHHGVSYSLGLALVMEGALSASYHLCPNKMNFQFDSSFMYVIAVLCIVKLYQGRHPDVNADAHATFLLLAAAMALGVFGIMYPSIYFWCVFTALHLATCLYLTLKIYYLGQLKLEASIFCRAYRSLSSSGVSGLYPRYPARALLLAIANVANWLLAAYGLYEHNKDFARHLLAILMGNAILYMLFYLCMKLVHRERILVHTWMYLVLAHVAWFVGLKLFLDSKTKWSETPAQSRRHNAVCSVLELFDTHDMWHVASAAAMFMSFNTLLTVDDALRNTPRDSIPVF